MNNKAKILLVEDDTDLAFLTKDSLELAGFEVDHTGDGEKALSMLEVYHYDICLLDVMLPNLDGFSIAKAIRTKNDELPILFLTARSLKDDRIKGLEIGADDYITKPFNIDELILKIKVFLRRSSFLKSESSSQLAIGTFILLPMDCILKSPTEEIKLTKKEAEVLEYLAQRPNEVLSRSKILKELWGKDDYFLGRSLDVFISRCRKYLKADPKVEIKTIYKVGFQLCT